MYDVIIVGAGPAGSTCARSCAKQGLKTLLLDQAKFPRPKPCGGAVSEQALSYLDFPLPPEIIEGECFSAHIHSRSHHAAVRRAHRLAVLVSRDRFDYYLAEKAVDRGVEFRQGERVIAVVTAADGVEARTDTEQYLAQYLVGADGVNSVAARGVRPVFSSDEIAAALVTTVPARQEDIDRRLGGSLDLTFGIAPLGYGWVFPHQGHYSVGVTGLASSFSRPQACLADFLRNQGLSAGPARGHAIPLGGMKRPITANRVLLAGDAAGFADPFHREGIVHAIHSGKLAAQAIAEGIGGRKDATARYAHDCERRIRNNLRIALRMARLLERYPDIFASLFFAHQNVLERYLDIPSGLSDYIRFQRWIVPRLPVYLLGHAVSKGRGIVPCS
jgi:geranylgeranyl reductase family protein